MGDELKHAAVAALGLALFLGFAAHRAEHAIVHDLRRSVRGGSLQASIRPKGPLGLATGEFASVRVTGSGISADDLPWRIQRGAGVRANTSRLEFDFRDVTLRGTPVTRFRALFPSVSLDAGRALFDEKIILRRAGEGTASAEVGPAALVGFICRKYPELRDVAVFLRPGFATVTASATLLGTVQQVEATGRLVVRQGRYLEIADMTVLLNGRPSTPEFARGLSVKVNPVVDLVVDLGIGDIFRAEEVEVGDGFALVRGRARVPTIGEERQKRAGEQRP